MASQSDETLENQSSKRIQRIVPHSDIPIEIWEEMIIPKLNHDNLHLQSLSLVSKYFLSITNLHKQTLNISNPTAHFLPSLLRRFPNLKHLSLANFSGHPSPVLLQFAHSDLRLESLDLSNLDRLPVEALQRLPSSTLSGVKSLKILSIHALSNDDLLRIADFFPYLDELYMSYSDDDDDDEDFYDDDGYDFNDNFRHSRRLKVTDEGISMLASKLTGLRKIHMSGNNWISDDGVISLWANCPYLEEIVVKDCNYVTDDGVRYALEECKNLKTFGLHGMRSWIEDIGLCLSRSLSLSVIHLSNIYVKDSSLLAVGKANLPLKSFSLINSKGFTFKGIASFFSRYNSLDHLALGGVDFLRDHCIFTFAKSLTKVRSVNLNHCKHLSDSTFITLVKRCPLLETLEITHAGIGLGFWGANAPVSRSRMTSLNLSSNKNLIYESLEKITLACPDLETLQLKSCVEISAKDVGVIMRNCPGLKHLEIDGCGNVKSLDLQDRENHELEFLGASGSGLGDKALIDIAKKCPQLRFLNVKDCARLTSKGVIQVVDKCTKLKEMNLHKCRNFSGHILRSMVFSRPSLKKIVLSNDHAPSANEMNLFLSHGCYVDVQY